ncbi:MAG: hypothetical protein ACFB2W_00700 [Leptolyngbyaceae cyanobacterium]
MHKVFIDGVKYVPATEVQPSDSRLIKIALLEDFWGDLSGCSDEELAEKWKDVYINVTDTLPRGWDVSDVMTIDKVLNRITELQTTNIAAMAMPQSEVREGIKGLGEK